MALDEIGRICRQFRINSLRPQLDACAEVLGEDDIVDVAVVGRFKAGKSSFLNSIIRQDVMPVAVLPLTAVVTRVRYGPKDQAIVQYNDGRRQEAPLDQMADFVTEQRNPGNAKGVAIVDVEVAGLLSYRGVRFVDTPGLGSVYAHNTRTSMEWLPRVGAALLAVSIDQPLSEYDVELLNELGKHTPEVSILLTKADLVSSKDVADVVMFVREQVARVSAAPVQIFPYSTRPGFEPIRQAVQDYLLEHVAARHEEKAREIVLYKLRSLIGECRQYLAMALSAAGAAQEARADLRRHLQEERHVLSTVRNELWLLANDLKTRTREACAKKFLEHNGRLAAALAMDLRSRMRQWKGNLVKTTEAFEQWAEETVHGRLAPLSRDEGNRLTQQQLTAAQSSFSRVVRAFQDRLADSIRKALGITFSGATFQARVKQPARPDVNIGRVFDTPFDLLWFVIPMWLFRPLVQRHFLRGLPWEVEKNLHRLTGQWSESIGRTVDDLARQAEDFVREELDTVEGLVAKAQDQRSAIEQAVEMLNQTERRLG
jgi:GTP-binding protein EngB required for normal cell division